LSHSSKEKPRLVGRPPATVQAPARAHSRRKLQFLGVLFVGFLGAFGLQIVMTSGLLLQMRVMHDAPIMAYTGFLLEHFRLAPYRDFFDMNLPGAYFAFGAIGRLFGYSDLALRGVDSGLLILILVTTGLALRTLGLRPALAAVATYGLAYTGLAQFHALQRESLVLVLASATLATLTPATRWPVERKAILSGLFLGAATCIKPGIALDAVPCLFYLLLDRSARPARSARRIIVGASFIAGFALPLALAIAYLVSVGSWQAFVEMATQYWPLYARLGALHETLADNERFGYLFEGIRAFGGHRLWLLPAGTGIVLALTTWPRASRERRFTMLLLALLVAHSIYPAISGQFWPYHWLPAIWSLSIASALCWVRRDDAARLALSIIAVGVFLVVLPTQVPPPTPLQRNWANLPNEDPYGARVSELSNFLKENVRAGEFVQPLDWTGGAVDAMLRSKVRLATPFIYDFHFYHHVSSPYIQRLRERFMNAMHRTRPTYVIRIESRKPWVTGVDTTHDFPALERFLRQHYVQALAGDGYQILKWSR